MNSGSKLSSSRKKQASALQVSTVDASRLVELRFLVHLIGMSGGRRTPNVRMLWVATTGIQAVYEGLVSWSICARWLKQLPHADVSKQDLAVVKESFKRYQYATLHGVRASFYDLESLGLQRVDGE